MAKETLVSLVNPKEKILLCNVTITWLLFKECVLLCTVLGVPL